MLAWLSNVSFEKKCLTQIISDSLKWNFMRSEFMRSKGTGYLYSSAVINNEWGQCASSCTFLNNPIKLFIFYHGSAFFVGHFPAELLKVTGSGCRPEEVWLKWTPGLWRAGSSVVPEVWREEWSRDLHQVCPLQGSQGSVSGERWGRGGGVGVGCRSSLQFPGDLEPRKRVAAASIQAVAPHAALEDSETEQKVGGGSNKRWTLH